MSKKSGIRTIQQHFKAGCPKRWLIIPKEESVIIHIEGPFDVGDVKHHETATSVSPGTEAGRNAAARRPNSPCPSTQELATEQQRDRVMSTPRRRLPDSPLSKKKQGAGSR